MVPRNRFFEKIDITQRQVVLIVLFLYFLAALAVVLVEWIVPTSDPAAFTVGGLCGAVLFGSAWILYYKQNWAAARYFAALASALLVGFFLPEPFVSKYAPMAVVLPVVLAYLLIEPFYVLVNGLLTIAILLIRAHGSGVYTQPTALFLYLMIASGLIVKQLIGETYLRQAKEAEARTRASESRFRNLIENSSEQVSIIDPGGTLLYESPLVRSVLGYSFEEHLGKSIFELVHPDDHERIRAVLAKLLQEPDLQRRERFRLLHKDRTWHWIEVVCSNLLHEPSIHGIIINYHDVTEQVQAEEKIQRQIQRLKGLRAIDIAIGSSLDLNVTLNVVLQQTIALLEVDACAVLLINSELQTIEYTTSRGFFSEAQPLHQLDLRNGYAGRVMVERRLIHIPTGLETAREHPALLHLAHEEFVDYCGAPLIVKGQVKGVLEIYHRSALQVDREWLELLETLAGQAAIAIENAQLFHSLQDANIELERRVADRTAELYQTNAELERANRVKDEFLASMSHELRTPLNSIMGLAESLLEQRRGELNEHQQKFLSMIESSGRHLLDLINDILDLSKIEAGKFDFYPQPVSLDEFCRSCLAFIKTQAYKKSISLTYVQEPLISKIFADPRRLKQILVNLLTNAVKFTPENGHITLRVNADLEQDLVQFSVIDTGIGIAPEDLQRLFKPFVQVDSSLSRQYEGTGLGLALVQKLTDLHGGSVYVESKVGQGSIFTINLPCKQNEIEKLENAEAATSYRPGMPEKKREAAPETAAHPGTLLLAEDNLSSVLTIVEHFESLGYKVVVAHDGLEALEKAGEICPDLILMDIQMPGMNGLEAMARLRTDARFATTPILALTALAMPGDRERCLLAGASEYMSKPVSLKALKQMIEHFLEAQPARP